MGQIRQRPHRRTTYEHGAVMTLCDECGGNIKVRIDVDGGPALCRVCRLEARGLSSFPARQIDDDHFTKTHGGQQFR